MLPPPDPTPLSNFSLDQPLSYPVHGSVHDSQRSGSLPCLFMHRAKPERCAAPNAAPTSAPSALTTGMVRSLLLLFFFTNYVLAFVRLACSLAAEDSHEKRRPMHIAHLLVLQKGVHGSNLGGVC